MIGWLVELGFFPSVNSVLDSPESVFNSRCVLSSTIYSLFNAWDSPLDWPFNKWLGWERYKWFFPSVYPPLLVIRHPYISHFIHRNPPIHNILPLLKRIRNARPPTLVITDSYWLIVILRKDLTNRIYTGRYTCWLRSFSRQSDKYTHHPPWWGSVRTIIVSQSNRARQRINASPSLTPPCSAWFNKVIRICFLMLPGTK